MGILQGLPAEKNIIIPLDYGDPCYLHRNINNGFNIVIQAPAITQSHLFLYVYI